MSDELPVQSTSASLVDRAKAIITQPKTEWQRIAAETTEPGKLLTSYVVPLALIGPIAGLIGMQLFGIPVLFATIKPSLATSLTIAVTSFVMAIVGAFVLAFIANWLSPKFGGRDSFPAAFRLVAYAMTAAWLGGIFGLFPALAIIGSLIGLYSFYLFYVGSSPVMGVPQDKAVGYTVVTVVAAIVLYLVVGAVTGAVTGNMMASAIAADNAATINFGGLGSVNVDGESSTVEVGDMTIDGQNSTIDLGELGRVAIDGETATLTVDGQEVQVNVQDGTVADAKAKADSAP